MKQEAIRQGWAARDEDGALWVYDNLPTRGNELWSCYGGFIEIPQECFPDIHWKDEPKKVTIKITIDE